MKYVHIARNARKTANWHICRNSMNFFIRPKRNYRIHLQRNGTRDKNIDELLGWYFAIEFLLKTIGFMVCVFFLLKIHFIFEQQILNVD